MMSAQTASSPAGAVSAALGFGPTPNDAEAIEEEKRRKALMDREAALRGGLVSGMFAGLGR